MRLLTLCTTVCPIVKSDWFLCSDFLTTDIFFVCPIVADSRADVCNVYTTCATCTVTRGCGWCSGSCVAGSAAGPFVQTCPTCSWAFTQSACPSMMFFLCPPSCTVCLSLSFSISLWYVCAFSSFVFVSLLPFLLARHLNTSFISCAHHAPQRSPRLYRFRSVSTNPSPSQSQALGSATTPLTSRKS